MSAFMVSKRHIDYLVTAAVATGLAAPGASCTVCGANLTDGSGDGVNGHWQDCDVPALGPDETGRMLWRECLRSLKYRYPDDGDGGRPGPIAFRDGDVDTYTWTAATAPTPNALHSLIRCYCYQSCEHMEWDQSQAFALMAALDAPLEGAEIETEWWGPPVEEDLADPA